MMSTNFTPAQTNACWVAAKEFFGIDFAACERPSKVEDGFLAFAKAFGVEELQDQVVEQDEQTEAFNATIEELQNEAEGLTDKVTKLKDENQGLLEEVEDLAVVAAKLRASKMRLSDKATGART